MGLIKDFSNIASGISNFASDVKEFGEDAVSNIQNGIDASGKAIADFAGNAETMVMDITSDVASAGKDFFDSSKKGLEKAVGSAVDGAKSIGSNLANVASDIGDWATEELFPILKDVGKNVADVVENVAATVVLTAQSLVEGVLEFGESIVDLLAIICTSLASIPTGMFDGCQAIYGAITGNEWESVTKKMWEKTQGFVSEQHVKGLFDMLYENTAYGKWLMDNAYFSEQVRTIGSGLGYLAGVVALTILTFGAGGVAVGTGAGATAAASSAAVTTTASSAAVTSGQLATVAGLAGVGKGAETAWKDGAGTVEGLVYALASGAWEGAQFFIGGKIGGSALFSKFGDNAGIKVLNSMSRIALDGADGGVEGFVQPLLKMFYKDESYEKLFNEEGSWNGVLTNAVIGSIGSSIGEAGGFSKKYLKDSNIKKNNGQMNVNSVQTSNYNSLKAKYDSSVKRYNELKKTIDSHEYRNYIYNAERGYAQDLSRAKEFDNATIEFKELKKNIPEIKRQVDMASKDSHNSTKIWKQEKMPSPTEELLKISSIKENSNNLRNNSINLNKQITDKIDSNIKKNIGELEPITAELPKFSPVTEELPKLSSVKENLSHLSPVTEELPKNSQTNSGFKKIKNKISEMLSSDKYVRTTHQQQIQDSLKKFEAATVLNDESEIPFLIGNIQEYFNNFNQEQIKEIDAYVRMGGPLLGAYERKANCKFVSRSGASYTYHGGNLEQIKREYEILQVEQPIYAGKTIDHAVKDMDNIIKKAPPLSQDTILYRGVNGVFFDGQNLNLTDLKVGTLINDKATVSTSVIKDACYSHNDIVLEILAPKGTKGVYLAGTGQEILLGRDTVMRVISEPEVNYVTGKTIIKVELVEKPNKVLKKYRNNLKNNPIMRDLNVASELKPLKKSDDAAIQKLEQVNAKLNQNKAKINVIDQMGIRNNSFNSNLDYDYKFNKYNDGVSVNDFMNAMKNSGLLRLFDDSISDIDRIYSHTNIVEHNIDHVKRVYV